MISYELGRALKEAGWPSLKMIEDHVVAVYAPTLSELIAACGDGFMSLTKRQSDWIADSARMEVIDRFGDPLMRFGSTPEEAVAMLWLALNKHDH